VRLQLLARWDSPEFRRAIVVLAAITLLTRGWIFGNPVFSLDEQFYLFVGDRMLDGQLPYVDIWDRKPIGLFLIYELAALLPHPVLAYQLLATVCAGLTAWVLFLLARRYASFGAALAGAAAYPAWLLVYAGIGGQSPVFYNLPMALAAVWTLAKYSQPDDRWLTRDGCAIMLLAGLSMQIKYSAVFEGVFFGLSLLWTGWRAGRRLPRLAGDGAIWIAVALIPTLAVWGAYAAIGHGADFLQANFLSVMADTYRFVPALERLAGLLAGLVPLGICVWSAWRHWRRAEGEAARKVRWLFAWGLASFLGFLAFGLYYDHYVLPLLPPLCLLAALGFDRIAWRKAAMAAIVGLGVVGGVGRTWVQDLLANGNAAEAARMADLVKSHLKGRCLYVNENLPYLYRVTGACLPTRFTFPQHLAMWRYEHGLGVDQLGEMRRVLASRPGVIVVAEEPDDDTRWATREAMMNVLKQAYRKVGIASVGEGRYTVYALTDAASREADAPQSAAVTKLTPHQ
jgi:hypothetical protein